MGSVIPADVAAPDVRLARRRQVEAAVDELRRALREEAPTYMKHVATWAKALDHGAPKLKPWPAAVRVAADRLRTPELQAARDRFAKAIDHARSHFQPPAPASLGPPAVLSRMDTLSTVVRSRPTRTQPARAARPGPPRISASHQQPLTPTVFSLCCRGAWVRAAEL